MRRIVKTKRVYPRVVLKNAALAASSASRRSFPAWIDANERTVAFPAITVTARVRDALVLRKVAVKKSAKGKGSSHAHGDR